MKTLDLFESREQNKLIRADFARDTYNTLTTWTNLNALDALIIARWLSHGNPMPALTMVCQAHICPLSARGKRVFTYLRSMPLPDVWLWVASLGLYREKIWLP